jgi:hypothetical protein
MNVDKRRREPKKIVDTKTIFIPSYIDEWSEEATILFDGCTTRSGDVLVLFARTTVWRERALVQFLQRRKHIFSNGGHNLGFVNLKYTAARDDNVLVSARAS